MAPPGSAAHAARVTTNAKITASTNHRSGKTGDEAARVWFHPEMQQRRAARRAGASARRKWFLPQLVTLGFLCLVSPVMGDEQDIERRVDALLARMTLTEKIGQMIQINDFWRRDSG